MLADAPLKTASDREIVVSNPYDGTDVATVERTAADDIQSVLQRAHRGAEQSRKLPRHERAAILEGAARIIENAQEEFARLITSEAGKTIAQARKETARCINTIRLSADAARTNAGEVIPFDSFAGSGRRQGWFTREPLGIIAAITPYNDPLNLVAHKLGPAIAGGNAIILKPSELTPFSALRLVEALNETGLPADIVTTVIGGADLGRAIVAARDVRMVSFTGGFATGEAIARTAGLKKLTMDLGGNAPVIVMADCDFDLAVEATVSGAYWAAGQNCIGAQRVLVHAEIYAPFKEAFVKRTMNLRTGDPRRSDIDVGPMISKVSLDRVEHMVERALAAGATLLGGHSRDGNCYAPTVLENVAHNCGVWTDEVFAPVAVLQPFNTFDEAIALANAPDYSLHAGIFTSNLDLAFDAADRLEAGGIMINDSSDYRSDAMPFGGYKYGSMGREGVRFAYEEMTQTKVVCVNRK